MPRGLPRGLPRDLPIHLLFVPCGVDSLLLGDIFVDASPDEFIGRLPQVLRHVGDYCREGNSLRNFPRWQPAMLRSVRCEPALAADEAFHVEPKHLRKIMFREEE